MLSVVVVDATAAGRNAIVEQITRFIAEQEEQSAFLPHLSLKPLAPQELSFNARPDVCIVGEQLVQSEITEVTKIRKLLQESVLIVRTNRQLENFFTIEQLARMGVDDTIGDQVGGAEFFRKLIMLTRRRRKTRSGKLIAVTSGKGGAGVTSLASGLAEALLDEGQRVVLLDLDFETQDLSRFLQVRPFINENLQLLLDRSRPVTRETVEQCLLPVWEGEERLRCMPPPADSDDLYDSRAQHPRTLLSIFEVLDAVCDWVVVDTGCARGALLQTVLRVADRVVFVVKNDPAALYACADRVSRARALAAPECGLLMVENAPQKSALPRRLLQQEFEQLCGLEAEAWLPSPIPCCSAAARWPGGGGTLLSSGSAGVRRALKNLSTLLGARGEQAAPNVTSWIARVSNSALRSPVSHEPIRALPAAAAVCETKAAGVEQGIAPAKLFSPQDFDELDPARLVSGLGGV